VPLFAGCYSYSQVFNSWRDVTANYLFQPLAPIPAMIDSAIDTYGDMVFFCHAVNNKAAIGICER
jgi:hypothetical protein